MARVSGDKGAWLYDLPGLVVDVAASKAAPDPTEAQKEAGNYIKGHVQFEGMDITIETARGQTRSGTAPDGTTWEVKMPGHYGYIKRTVGADEEQLDVLFGKNLDSPKVFVIDQKDLDTGLFDEHKIIFGSNSRNAARRLYNLGFSDGKGPQRIQGITEMTMDEFKVWKDTSDTTQSLTDEGTVPLGPVQKMPKKPMDAFELIAREGGILDNGDIRGMDLQRKIRGVGDLVTQDDEKGLTRS